MRRRRSQDARVTQLKRVFHEADANHSVRDGVDSGHKVSHWRWAWTIIERDRSPREGRGGGGYGYRPEPQRRDVPDYMFGNISFEIMRDPVIAPSGITCVVVGLCARVNGE